jgi:hypothetical protein
VLHVVDIFFAAAGGKAALGIAINEIKSRYDEVTIHRGKVLSYLGMSMDFSKDGEDYAVKIYEEKYGELSVSRTPANDDILKVNEASGMLSEYQSSDYETTVFSETPKI